MANKKKKMLGRVCISHSYVVDLDNPEMIQEAKDCLFEDLMNAYKYDEVHLYIDVKADKTASVNDIPDFLLKEEEGEKS